MTMLHTASYSPVRPAAPARTGRLARLIDTAYAVNTPALLIDPSTVEANYRRLSAAFPASHTYYAIKANPHPAILRALIEQGCGLDVASGHETDLALHLGAHPSRICFSAPFKRATDIAAAYRRGISLFAADSAGEVDKIACNAPGARVLIRVAVAGGTCLTPMGSKFGANISDVVPLLERARAAGLAPWGLHFHVGSQCLDADAWARAIALCSPLWRAARERGIVLKLMDIGGGFPVRYDSAVPSIETIAASTLAAVSAHLPPRTQLGLEPGRWMSRSAAVLVTEVIGTATRGSDEWVYLDAGVYNGLIDTLEGVVYPMRGLDELATGRRRPRRRVTLAGPSCDGNDVMLRGMMAPELMIGDRLLFFQAGAYTTAFDRFNGIDFPVVIDLTRGELLERASA